MGIAEELERMRHAVLASAGEHVPGWFPDFDIVFKPPASQAEVDQLEQAVGCSLPAKLRELYAFTNGGQICYGGWPSAGRAVEFTLTARDIMAGEPDLAPFALTPDRQLPWIAGGAGDPFRVICEVDDDRPGRVLILDLMAENLEVDLWNVAADDLEAYFACLADFAELGDFVLQRVDLDAQNRPHGSLSWSEAMRTDGPTLDDPLYDNAEGRASLNRYGISRFF